MKDSLCLRRNRAEVPCRSRDSKSRVRPSRYLANCTWSKKVKTSPRRSSDVEVNSWDKGNGIRYEGLNIENIAGEMIVGVDRLDPAPGSMRIAWGLSHVSPRFSTCSRSVLVRI